MKLLIMMSVLSGIGLISAPYRAEAETYVISGVAFATQATIKGYKNNGKLANRGKWVNDNVICKRTNGYILAVSHTVYSKNTCWFDIFYGKNLKPGWKFINSRFKKVSGNSMVSYRIKKRFKNTNRVFHGIQVTAARAPFGDASVRLINITLEGPSNARWTDAL